MPLAVWPGRPDPLGATWDGHGTNFAVFAPQATRVELCLFDNAYGKETARITLPEQTRLVWHAYINNVIGLAFIGWLISVGISNDARKAESRGVGAART